VATPVQAISSRLSPSYQWLGEVTVAVMNRVAADTAPAAQAVLREVVDATV
jgi:hypothetical protein